MNFPKNLRKWLDSYVEDKDDREALQNQICYLHHKATRKAIGIGFFIGIGFTLTLLKYLG